MIGINQTWFDIAVSLKTKFKRHILGEFHGYSMGVSALWALLACKVSRLAGEEEEEEEEESEKEDDETRFSPLPASL